MQCHGISQQPKLFLIFLSLSIQSTYFSLSEGGGSKREELEI